MLLVGGGSRDISDQSGSLLRGVTLSWFSVNEFHRQHRQHRQKHGKRLRHGSGRGCNGRPRTRQRGHCPIMFTRNPDPQRELFIQVGKACLFGWVLLMQVGSSRVHRQVTKLHSRSQLS